MTVRAAMLTAAAGALLLTGAAAAAPPPAAAVDDSWQAAGPGWSAWYGCWRQTDAGATDDSLVCVLPGESAASVRVATLVDGVIADETVIHADGVARPVEEGGCTGAATASWSRDGRRVFVRSEFDCGGLARVSTGVLAMIAENEWIDVQALTVAGQHAARSVRYRAVRVEDTPPVVAGLLPQDRRLVQETARLQASAPLDVAAVVEASAALPPPAVEALLAARQQGFSMSASMLAQLERQQVPPTVIDMMVALSYPDRFAVQERPRSAASAADMMAQSAWRPARAGMIEECYDPFFMQTRYRGACDSGLFQGSVYRRYGYDTRYGYGTRYGYSPWGYDPYGWRDGRDPIVVIISPGDTESTRGEVVKGRGYSNPGGTTARDARPRAQPANSGAAAGRTTTTQPSSPPASTTSGSSGDTSTGTSTGRTAVPRPPGGGV